MDHNSYRDHSNVRNLRSVTNNHHPYRSIGRIRRLRSNIPSNFLRHTHRVCLSLHLPRSKLIFILSRLRHYPTLASLQFQYHGVRLMIVVYFVGSMIYLTFCESCEMHWLMVVIKIFSNGDLQMVSEISRSHPEEFCGSFRIGTSDCSSIV